MKKFYVLVFREDNTEVILKTDNIRRAFKAFFEMKDKNINAGVAVLRTSIGLLATLDVVLVDLIFQINKVLHLLGKEATCMYMSNFITKDYALQRVFTDTVTNEDIERVNRYLTSFPKFDTTKELAENIYKKFLDV